MSELERFGVSMPHDLLKSLDDAVAEAGYPNRSEALRDIVRDYLTAKRWQLPDGEVVGTVTLVYDHHTHDLQETLTEIQHDAGGMVV